MRPQQGFTLLELIIALAIFSVMSVMAYSGLKTVLDSKEVTQRHGDRLSELQTAMLLMQRDVEQMLDRPVVDDSGTLHEALLGGSFGTYLMEFTRAGWQNPLPNSSNIQRVAYIFEDGTLLRLTWPVLDGFGGEPISRPLIGNLESVSVRYMTVSGSNDYIDSWPPPAATGAAGLPKAVEVTLEFKDMGKIRRVFRAAVG